MKGDFSRLPYPAAHPYTGVWMQQGRVQLDADWNEQLQIAARDGRQALLDTLGGSGAPAGAAGFRVAVRGGLRLAGGATASTPAAPRAAHPGEPFSVELGLVRERGDGGGPLAAIAGAWSLSLDARGAPVLALGDGSASLAAPRPLPAGRPARLRAAWTGAVATLSVDGDVVAAAALGPRWGAADGGVVVGGGEGGRAVVWELSLRQGGRPAACWPLDEGTGPEARDTLGGAPLSLGAGGGPAPRWTGPTLVLGAGRYYVDGTRVDNPGEVAFGEQPDLPGAELPADGDLLLYLDVWERYLGWAEAPGIREVALGGPDTTGRTAAVWQVRWAPWERGLPAAPADGRAWLSARRTAPPAPAGGNQLYRVEVRGSGAPWGLPRAGGGPAPRVDAIARDPAEPTRATLELAHGAELGAVPGSALEIFHHPHREGALVRVLAAGRGGRTLLVSPLPAGLSAGEGLRARAIATFAWSSDNGSTVAAVRGVQAETGMVEVDAGGPGGGPLAPGDLVELCDDRATLRGEAGPLRRVAAVDADAGTVTLAPAPLPAGSGAGGHPLLRRWSDLPGAEHGPGTAPMAAGVEVELGSGVRVTFAGEWFAAGDYWTLPVRVDAPGGLEWPRRGGEPVLRPPQGIAHAFAPLARVRAAGGACTVLQDLRRIVPPLAGGGEWVGTTGPQEMAGPLRVGGALEVGGGIVGTLEPRSVHTRELARGAVTPSRLSPRVGVVPPGCYLLGDTPHAPPGYAWTGGWVAVQGGADAAWTALPPLPPLDAAVRCVSLAGWVWAVCDGGGPILRWAPGRGGWEEGAAPLGREWRGFGVGALDGRLWAMGGVDAAGHPLTALSACDPATGAWEPCAPMPFARAHAAVAGVEGRLLVMGGLRKPRMLGFVATAQVAAYDPAADAWERRRPMARRRAHAAAAVLDGEVFVLGGTDGSRLGPRVLDAVEAYRWAADEWRDATPLPGPRQRMGAAALDGQLWVAGGEGPDGAPLDRVNAYSPSTGAWCERTRLREPRASPGLVAHGGALVVAGGRGPWGWSGAVEELGLVDRLYPYRREPV
jgi:hypothetical protein